jgi:hypothetical protein
MLQNLGGHPAQGKIGSRVIAIMICTDKQFAAACHNLNLKLKSKAKET